MAGKSEWRDGVKHLVLVFAIAMAVVLLMLIPAVGRVLVPIMNALAAVATVVHIIVLSVLGLGALLVCGISIWFWWQRNKGRREAMWRGGEQSQLRVPDGRMEEQTDNQDFATKDLP